MTNDSSTGGILTPESAAPAADAALDAVLQALVVGCTGLTGSLVRPRWQPVVPKQPEPNIDWCSIGVQTVTPIDTAARVHQGSDDGGLGTDLMVRQELIEVIASFYGPNSMGNALLLRDGVAIEQNNEGLASAGLAFVATMPVTPAPALVNQQWVRKWDLRLTFARQITRTYPIRNIASLQGEFLADDGVTQPFSKGP